MHIIKIPYSTGSLGRATGTEIAPKRVTQLLEDYPYNEEGKSVNFDIDEIKIDAFNMQEASDKIYENIKQAKDCIVIGGDHSITYSCFKAFSEKHKNPGLLVFDSHPDCVDNFKPPTHEDFLRVIIEDKLLKKENVVMAGLRSIDEIERKYIEKNKLKTYEMKNIENIEDFCDALMSIVKNFDALYLSIDIDAIDPAFAPGTGVAEPGGFTSRQFIYLIQRLKKLKNLRMVDIVEVNPMKDINNITSKLAAKIISELS